jgi:hypothetical protein
MPSLTGLRLERAQASRQFRDGRFHNTSRARPQIDAASLPVVGEFFFGGRARVPPAPLPVESPLAAWARSTGGRACVIG